MMPLCYSKLSAHYKSCLQYVTAFFKEKSISRTILIRRWVAEGLVASGEELETMEEAGELCFDELVFRGFVQPVPPVVPGVKIKSCRMEEPAVREFVIDMAKSENFVAGGLPEHLQYQQEIRKFAQQSTTTKAAATASRLQIWCPWNICPRKPLQDDDGVVGASKATEEKQQHPMDEMVLRLKTLPELYRLNVLDLGGCKGLTEWHLVSICKAVPSLKYLSLRNIDVSQLPKNINNLKQLETLDIRRTNITTVDDINLPNLKHLLAGHIPHCPPPGKKTDESPLTVPMPNKIGLSMEILRHVQIIDGKADRLERVGQQLRKLGVVLNGSEDDMMKHLFRAITRSSECLRSLPTCIKPPPLKVNDSIALKSKDNTDILPKNLESLNIKYFRESNSNGTLALPLWVKELNKLSKITL
jgi:hypothetical protein